MIGKNRTVLGLATVTIITLLFCGQVLSASAAPLVSTRPLQPYQPGEIVVKFRQVIAFQTDAASGLKSLDEIKQKYSVTAVQPLIPPSARVDLQTNSLTGQLREALQRTYLIKFEKNSPVEEVISAYKNLALVETAEPNYLRRIMRLPDEPDFYRQWGMNNTAQEYRPGRRGKAGADISAVAGWEKSVGSRNIVVAVIDTGIQLDHPDLMANLWHNPGEIPNNGIDDDQNGFIDDYQGWDFVESLNDTSDDNGHGTQMAGIIGAVGNNGIGLAGVNWETALMPVKVLNQDGWGTAFDIAAGITYAASNGARILNLSIGGHDSAAVEADAVAYAVSADCFLAAASGNDGTSQYNYPAAYGNVTGVAATDDEDGHPSFSNYNNRVDLSAPGVNIYTTSLGSAYDYYTGTSHATAFVSGAAAWVLTNYTLLGYDDLELVLEDFADDLGAVGYDPYFGNGRIDLNIALTTPYLVKVTISDLDTGDTTYTNAYQVQVCLHYIGTPSEILLSTKADGSDGAWQDWDDFLASSLYTFPSIAPNKTPEGTVLLYARLKDANGDVGNVRSGNIILDITAPELSQGVAFDDITEVKSGDLIPARPVIKFSATDSVSGVRDQGAFVSLDTQPLSPASYDPTTGQFVFTLPADLAAGLHNISVGGIADRAGNALALVELKNLRVASAPAAADFDSGVRPFGWYDPTTGLIYIGYSLTGDAAVKVRVYDLAGNCLWQNTFAAGAEGGHFGYNQISWDGFWSGRRLNYGVYPFILSLASGHYVTGNLVFVPR